MSTICTDKEVEGRRDLGCPLLVMPKCITLSRILSVVSLFDMAILFEPSDFLVEVSACQLMIKMQRDVG